MGYVFSRTKPAHHLAGFVDITFGYLQPSSLKYEGILLDVFLAGA